MKNNAEHHRHEVSSELLRVALKEHFSEEFGAAILSHFKVNGVIHKPVELSHGLKAAIGAIGQFREDVRIPLAQILLKTPEFKDKKGDALVQASKVVRDQVKNLLTNCLH